MLLLTSEAFFGELFGGFGCILAAEPAAGGGKFMPAYLGYHARKSIILMDLVTSPFDPRCVGFLQVCTGVNQP